MAYNASLIFAEVLGATPASVNPFLALRAFITAQFYPAIPRSFDIQLYILSALFAVCVVPARSAEQG